MPPTLTRPPPLHFGFLDGFGGVVEGIWGGWVCAWRMLICLTPFGASCSLLGLTKKPHSGESTPRPIWPEKAGCW